MSDERRVLLLDLGGVLADLGDPVSGMALDLDADQFWQIWLNSSSVRAFETGAMPATEFYPAMAQEFDLSDGGDFERRFQGWRLSLFAGAEDFLRSVTARYRLALLSNTNVAHWQQIVASTAVFALFDRVFLSFETGHFKPSIESYRQVVTHFDCRPAEILFLDDSVRNVDSARDLQIDAHQVRGLEEARQVVALDTG